MKNIGEMKRGYCQCGCGEKTNLIKWSDKSNNLVRGNYYRFRIGHANKLKNWARQRRVGDGRLVIYKPSHQRAMANGYVFNHLLIAERVFGRPIMSKINVHHVNLDKSNDKTSNLVICQDRAYHGLLHQRTRAVKACGHANYLKCSICGEYDKPENITLSKKTKYHKDCRNDRRREQYRLGLNRW